MSKNLILWEVFIQSKVNLPYKHVGTSIWVVESKNIIASNPDESQSFFDPANDKIYRHPTFYDLPDGVKHI